MFEFTYNLVSTTIYYIVSIVMLIITGRIPRVSAYHIHSDNYSLLGICDPKNEKVFSPEYVDDTLKEELIKKFIDHLMNDPNFINPVSEINFPYFDGKEIIGTNSCYSVILNSLNKYLNDYRTR